MFFRFEFNDTKFELHYLAYPKYYTLLPGEQISIKCSLIDFYFQKKFFFKHLHWVDLVKYENYFRFISIIKQIKFFKIFKALAFTCAGTGVRELCNIYSEVTGTDPLAAQGLFFGILGVFLQLGNEN